MNRNDRIYYVANARMPNDKAHGIQIAKMCEAFVESGVHLELIVPRRRGAEEGTLKDFCRLRVPIPMTRLPVIDWYRGGTFGFFFSSLSFICSYTLYLLWKRVTAPGVIYTIDMDSFSSFMLPFFGMPVFTEMHTPKKKTIATNIFFRAVDGVIATNTLIKENLKSTFNVPDAKLSVEPNGIDLRQFVVPASKTESRHKLGLPLNKKIVLYVGRFYQWKGLEIIPQVARELPDDILLYMVGGAREEFERIVDGELIPENIVFAGARDYAEIPTWLSAADTLLVLGTKENDDSYRYTSPMKVFEYLVSGRPVIASGTPAIKDVLTEREVVWYEPDNATSLSDQIQYVLTHTDEMEVMTRVARAKAEQFSWGRRAERILENIRTRVKS